MGEHNLQAPCEHSITLKLGNHACSVALAYVLVTCVDVRQHK